MLSFLGKIGVTLLLCIAISVPVVSAQGKKIGWKTVPTDGVFTGNAIFLAQGGTVEFKEDCPAHAPEQYAEVNGMMALTSEEIRLAVTSFQSNFALCIPFRVVKDALAQDKKLASDFDAILIKQGAKPGFPVLDLRALVIYKTKQANAIHGTHYSLELLGGDRHFAYYYHSDGRYGNGGETDPVQGVNLIDKRSSNVRRAIGHILAHAFLEMHKAINP